MQGISQFRSCVDRLITFPFVFYAIHLLQGGDDLADCILPAQLFLQISIHNQSDKAGNEMGEDPLLPLYIYGSCFEIRFHYPEAFFDFPAPLVYFYNGLRVILQICAHRIETIILLLFMNHILINVAEGAFSDFACQCRMGSSNKPFWIVLPLLFNCAFPIGNQFLCPFNLPISYGTEIIPVFNRIRYDQFLLDFNGFCFPVFRYLGFFFIQRLLK